MRAVLEAILGFDPDRQGGGLGYIEAENNARLLATFLPTPRHRKALDLGTVLIRGGRGAGKSALFRLATEIEPRTVQALFEAPHWPQVQWRVGFSQQGTFHPEIGALTAMAKEKDDSAIRAFWAAHLLVAVWDHLGKPAILPEFLQAAIREERYTNPLSWVNTAVTEAGAVISALDQLESTFTSDLVIAYDHLDRIMLLEDPQVRSRFLRALLDLWLSLTNRYQRLHGKIFLREDLYEDASRFADASKLQGRSVQLDWAIEDLYRVVVRHFTDAGDPVRAWLRKIPKLKLQDRGEFGWMPGPMPEPVQEAFATALAGQFMGASAQKGFTHRWIPNHLQDALGRVVPRSMLNLFAGAAKEALRSLPDDRATLFKPSHLVAAITPTSIHRVAEVAEEAPIVNRMQNLRGEILMIDQERAVQLLARPVGSKDASFGTNGESILAELIRLGVVGLRLDGRLNVPDLYRHGFGIKRKGGAARAK